MRTLVVGVGSDIRGDDGVGLHVVRELKSKTPTVQADVIEVGNAGLGLLDSVRGYERLILVDAIVTGSAPGTLHELQGDDVARASHLGPGHDADLPTVLALGEKLMGGDMPKDVVVVAVEAGDLNSVSTELTPSVAAAIPQAVARVQAVCGNATAI